MRVLDISSVSGMGVVAVAQFQENISQEPLKSFYQKLYLILL